jgi:hypothetical protein
MGGLVVVFNYGTRPSTCGLLTNPASHADRRREPNRGPLAFYSRDQIEELADSLAKGAHRDPSQPPLSPAESEARAREDVQDAELARVASYAGLRRGELQSGQDPPFYCAKQNWLDVRDDLSC